jgi:hypothetical protein
MKFYLTDFSEDNIIDTNIDFCFKGYIPKYSSHQFVSNIDEADVIIFGYATKHDYKFKEYDIGNKPIIIIDYNELGPDTKNTHFICFNCVEQYSSLPEWKKLNEWLKLKSDQIKIYFKREFEQDSYRPNILTYPIEYMSFTERFWNQQSQSFEDFNKRIFNIAFIFGLSNSHRPLLLSKIIEKCYCCNMCFDERILEY